MTGSARRLTRSKSKKGNAMTKNWQGYMVRALLAATVFSYAATASVAEEKKLEVLHFFTAGSEAAAIGVIKDAFTAKGYGWVDLPATGTDTLNQVLRSRVTAGSPPNAVLMHSNEVKQWVDQGALVDLSPIATKGNWDEVMSKGLIPHLKLNGSYYGVPTTVERTNWLWYNKKVFDKLGLQPPTTLDEFHAVADKLKAAGVIPLAIGGVNWQEATLFETVLVAVGGPDFYRKAIVEQNEEALKSETMIKVFDEFRNMNKYVDPNYPGRDWNIAAKMVMTGEAGMQVLGDYVKGEMVLANLKPNVDYGCAPPPGNAQTYLSVSTAFVFFKSKDASVEAAQDALAETTFDSTVQLGFNLKKGATPARTDVDSAALDFCAQASYKAQVDAASHGQAFPAISHFEAWSPAKSGIFMDVVSTFFEQPSMTSKAAVDQLVTGLKTISE
ncbi:ABC transporter substrate-binding protein [Mesorhizobium sp. M2E.F.Ca.ET.219.01.1.1]|uniref:ABC transporter substrate-binding protein n=2 Tax=Mesorhizobium TaxID=68287 RepID=UPI000FE430B4|nr:ABC transporter substrate-binding protein [Mesorhizobium sp. M2E.F.Ca.ET.219.01.1.1]TGQ04797.1 carbohydrate ABC transporter substrate-binding protein [Mesorhizobium sp. M2E.F.Ca.ET.219.01.1.1]